MRGIVYLITLFLLSSCGKSGFFQEVSNFIFPREEKIIPIVAPRRVGEKTYSFVLKIDEEEIINYDEDYLGGNVPLLGGFFSAISTQLVNAVIDIRDGITSREPMDETFYFPELDDVDFDFVKGLRVDRVHLKMTDDVTDNDFKFLKDLKIILVVDENDDHDNIVGNKNPKTRKEFVILRFSGTRDRYSCIGRCIDMRVVNIDWKRILKKYRRFGLVIDGVASRLPGSKMKIGGHVKFNVTVKYPF